MSSTHRERELSSDTALRVLNGLLLVTWLAALVGWIVFENRRYEALATELRAQQELKSRDVIESARQGTLGVARLLRDNRLVTEALVAHDRNKLLAVAEPMLNLPHVQLLTLYRPTG